VNVGDAYRVQSWRAALEITLSDPLTGGGWGSLSRLPEFSAVGIAASHNLILNSFADGGVPLGLTFGGVVLYSVVKMWSNRRWIAPSAIAGATALLFIGLWDIPNLRSYGAVMGGLALGLVARKLSHPVADWYRRPR
jgi:O-antigen ligase